MKNQVKTNVTISARDHLDNGFPTVRSEDRTFPRLVGDENIKSLN